MFPMPIEKWKPFNRALYRISVPVALLIWLLPMLTALVTSVRSNDELMAGNYWGWPQDFAMLENYREALTASPMLHYFWNSCLITIPSVIGAISLAAMAGFALSTYQFRGNTVLFATFVACNFVPQQILMIPVRDLSLSLGLFNDASGRDALDPERLAALAAELAELAEQIRPGQDVNSAEPKALLRANTEAAQAAGVFGVPAFVVDGKVFWGLDALPMLRAYLEGDAWFDGPDWDAAPLTPSGLPPVAR